MYTGTMVSSTVYVCDKDIRTSHIFQNYAYFSELRVFLGKL